MTPIASRIKAALSFSAFFLTITLLSPTAPLIQQVWAESDEAVSPGLQGAQPILETNDEVVTKVFNKMVRQGAGDWAYERKEVKDAETKVEGFDPARGAAKAWKLLSVDGRSPSAAELETYEKEGEARSRRSHPGEFKLYEMTDLGSFSVVDSAGSQETYRFDVAQDPEDESGKDFSEYLEGRLVVDSDKLEVVSMRLYSKEPFSPVFSVKIDKVDLGFAFSPSIEGGPQFLSKFKQATQGKILGMKKIDEKSTVLFSAFKASTNP